MGSGSQREDAVVSPEFTKNFEYKIDHISKTKIAYVSEHCASFGTKKWPLISTFFKILRIVSHISKNIYLRKKISFGFCMVLHNFFKQKPDTATFEWCEVVLLLLIGTGPIDCFSKKNWKIDFAHV